MSLQANEINEIVARAMSEYNRIHSIPPDSVTPVEILPEAEVPVVTETTMTSFKTNSKSILVDEATSRFSSAIWYNLIKEQGIVLAGLGGIGSYVAFLLSRMQPKIITLYDDDIVERGNMSGQMFGTQDIGRLKVSAVTQSISNYSDYHSYCAFSERFTETSLCSDIMICGFDNMEARKIFFEAWLRHKDARSDKSKCLFIDGRLAAEEFQVFTIQGNDERAIKEYQDKWLFTDREADPTICSYKQTSFCANMIASIMVNTFVNFIANQCNPLISRDVPFLVEYNAETMYFKVIQ